MASKELVVDDEYVGQMADYILKQGAALNKDVAVYITILTELKNKGIVSGNTANALSSYIKYAEGLQGKIHLASSNIYRLSNSYVAALDKADQFLF